ncbi:Putative ribonuclease H protein At1g65750 [Linum perenne]
MSLLANNRGLRFGVVCWFLWRARNERLFAGSVEGANAIAARCLCWEGKVGEALNFERDCLESGRKSRQIQVAWQAGPEGWLIVNTDGSVQGINGKAAAGGLLRDEAGNCLFAFAINLGNCSITRAEIRGALKGIREANQAADYLANLGHTLPRGCHSISCSDCNLAYHVRYDCMGISEPRLIN